MAAASVVRFCSPPKEFNRTVQGDGLGIKDQ